MRAIGPLTVKLFSRLALLRTVTPNRVTDTDHAGVDVHRALMTLPGQQRAAITLYYLEDRPVSEIATLMRCGEVTVRTHLARGRKTLATRLGEEYTDEPR